MSLHWDLTKIADYQTTCLYEAPEDVPSMGTTKGDILLKPVSHALVLATMAVGIGRLTEDKAGEFFARLEVLQRCRGVFVYGPGGVDHFITLAEVEAHIGLTTNVSAEGSASWWKRTAENIVREGRSSDLRAAKTTAQAG